VTAGEVAVVGEGTGVETDPIPLERSLADFMTCTIRHGDAERIECAVQGPELRISPVSAGAAPVLLGNELRDFGAVAARMHVEALRGSVAIDREILVVRLAA
jgi:hypothetical protein